MKTNKKILISQILIGVMFLLIWEILAKLKVIDVFITSSPSEIIKTIYNLYINNNLFSHIWITFSETLLAFILTFIISLIISIILYQHNFLAKILDPYLTLLNSLPKVALGPILIIWIGANPKTIVLMGILISVIVSIQNIYVSFINTDKTKIKLMQTFKATKKEILIKLIIPSNIKMILSSAKINISLCLIGIIMGEFLTSKSGIGYLIMYGSQVFNLNLVMSGIILLLILSIFMYNIIRLIEKRLEQY